MNQEGDVLLFQTVDNGEINIENGIIEMSGGLQTAAYISLFGGNEDDDGNEKSLLQYWANFNENEPEKKYRSETQFLLRSIPTTSSNLLRIEQAAKRDLLWLSEEVTVTATIPGLNKIKLVIELENDRIEFEENWRVKS